MVLLSKEMPAGGAALPNTYAMASVEAHEGLQSLRLRLHLDQFLTEGPSAARTLRMRAGLQALKSAWWIMKLCNLSTISREYAALHAATSLPFFDVLLHASATGREEGGAGAPEDVCWAMPQRLQEQLDGSHNESQLSAISAALCRRPVVLIQGPPGTGKTQTILGLLSTLLHSTPLQAAAEEGQAVAVVERPALGWVQKVELWAKAAPWLLGAQNIRDALLPDEDHQGSDATVPNPGQVLATTGRRKHRTHVLVCAPSNAALDEIVLRLLNTGLRDENGDSYIPNVVRVGLNAHHTVAPVTMDKLVAQRLSSVERGGVVQAGRGGSAGMERDRMRLAILDEAAIVCSTLSFSGSGMFSRMSRPFDVVIVDEAAQAVEPSTLVPLSHGCRQLFLVGDPIQLPATVLSSKAVEHGYGMSMFKRFQAHGYPVRMLRTQYRMHPEIRYFPSKEFYEDSLLDGEAVVEQTKRPWHEHRCFGPLAVFDVPGKEECPEGGGSWVNKDEVEFVLILYRHMVAMYPQLADGPHLAVISPYKAQVKLLRERFRDALGREAAQLIDINTIDGFQGREKDVAIFSCVRSSRRGIGFVSDYRRMNVGITRARASMLVVGCAAALRKDKHWGNLVKHARFRKVLFKIQRPFKAIFSQDSLAKLGPVEAVKEAEPVGGQVDKEGEGDGESEEELGEELIEEHNEAIDNFGEFDEEKRKQYKDEVVPLIVATTEEAQGPEMQANNLEVSKGKKRPAEQVGVKSKRQKGQ